MYCAFHLRIVLLLFSRLQLSCLQIRPPAPVPVFLPVFLFFLPNIQSVHPRSLFLLLLSFLFFSFLSFFCLFALHAPGPTQPAIPSIPAGGGQERCRKTKIQRDSKTGSRTNTSVLTACQPVNNNNNETTTNNNETTNNKTKSTPNPNEAAAFIQHSFPAFTLSSQSTNNSRAVNCLSTNVRCVFTCICAQLPCLLAGLLARLCVFALVQKSMPTRVHEHKAHPCFRRCAAGGN